MEFEGKWVYRGGASRSPAKAVTRKCSRGSRKISVKAVVTVLGTAEKISKGKLKDYHHGRERGHRKKFLEWEKNLAEDGEQGGARNGGGGGLEAHLEKKRQSHILWGELRRGRDCYVQPQRRGAAEPAKWDPQKKNHVELGRVAIGPASLGH